MLPLTQQRYFEVHNPRAATMTARDGMRLGHAALPFNTNQAGSPDIRTCAVCYRASPRECAAQ